MLVGSLLPGNSLKPLNYHKNKRNYDSKKLKYNNLNGV